MPPASPIVELILNAVTAIWLGMLGSCVGSFLNVVAYRLPLGLSVVWKPSHCPHCQHAIRARDNLPVFGWLLLGGRCRDCGQPIAGRYAIVELSLGLIFVLLAYTELYRGGTNLPGWPVPLLMGALDTVWFPNWPLLGIYAYHCVLLSLLMAIALIALDKHSIPLRLVGIGLGFGLIPPIVWPRLQPTMQNGNSILLLLLLLASTSLGALLGMPFARLFGLKGFVIALAWIGAFLGWLAVLTIAAITLTATSLLPHRFLQHGTSATIYPWGVLIAATLVQIIWWNYLVDLLKSLL